MSGAISILHLEDSMIDAELIAHELKRSPLSHTITHVVDEHQFRSALERGNFDVILSDYRLGLYDGDQALVLARHVRPEIPFIMVTGELGETRAIETIKRGATDYVLKDNLKRLVPAIERAIKEAEIIKTQKAAEEALRINGRHLQAVIDNNPECVKLVDCNGNLLAMNPAGLAMIEAPDQTSVLNKCVYDIIAPEYRAAFQAMNERVCAGHKESMIFQIQTLQGKRRWMDSYAVPIVYPGQNKQVQLAMTRDITERREAEEALRQSEEWGRHLLSLMPAAVYTCDAEGRITFFNQRAAELWGRSPRVNDPDERFCGSFLLWQTDDIALPHNQTPMAVAIHQGLTFRNQDVIIERPDGSRIKVMVNIDPIRDAAGRIMGAINVFQDVTEIRKVQELLENSERHKRELLQSIPAAIYTTDRDGRVTFFNEAAAGLWGRRPEIGKDLWCGSWKIYRPDGSPLPLDDCPMARTLREGKPVVGEEIVVERPGGSRVTVLPHPQLLRDNNENIVGAVNMLIDISERKEAERTQAHLAAIVQASDDAIVSKSLDGIVTSWNIGAERIFGYHADEMIGKSILTIIPPELQNEERMILARLRNGDRIDHFDTIRVRKDGRRVEISLTISPIRDSSGTIIGVSKIARDITERRQREREIQQLNEELEHRVAQRTSELAAANVELDAFSYSVSHDLRAPLRAIKGFSSILKERYSDGLPQDAAGYLQKIDSTVGGMEELIGALLSLSRVKKHALTKTEVDMGRLFQESFQSQLHAETERRTVTLNVEQDLGTIEADSILLRQVVANLVSNALKFSRNKLETLLEVGRKDRTSEAVFWIRDNGDGFDAMFADKLFGVFQRLHHQDEFEGHGIGLALCRRIIERHGGRIWAQANKNEGATFFFSLPTNGLVKSEGSTLQPRQKSVYIGNELQSPTPS